MKKKLLVLIFAGCSGSSLAAQDLLQSFKLAQQNDSTYASAIANSNATASRYKIGRASILPQIAITAEAAHNQATLSASKLPNKLDLNYNSNNYGIQLIQPLLRATNWMTYKQAEMQTDLATVQRQLADQDLIVRLARAYFEVLAADDGLAALETLQKAVKEQLNLAKTSFEIGTVTITDVHEAQSRYDIASARLIAARTNLEVKQAALARITGAMPGSSLAGLRSNASMSLPDPADAEKWAAAARLSSLQVSGGEIQEQLAEQEHKKSRAGHLPTLDLQAHAAHISDETDLILGRATTEGSRVGVVLNIPLYAGGAISAKSDETAALVTKAQADLESARKASAQAAREAYAGVSNGLAQVKALEAAEVSSRSSLAANRLGYEVGVRINIDVLNSQSQLADTVQQLANSRYMTLLAHIQLKASVGQLSEADLIELNGLLNH